MSDDLSPAGYAQAINEARQRLITFVEQCQDDVWHAAPVTGDPRPVSVIADHVADAYQYLCGFIADVAAGRPVAVNSELVDDLNAEHAAGAADLSRAQVAGHLREQGDVLIALITGFEPSQLDLDGGRIRRLATIAARHADGHRTEIEAALATSA
jgi:DinB superfamily